MDFIAGAKILAERFGGTTPVDRQVPIDASPLFHWCGVDPTQPELPDVGTWKQPAAHAEVVPD
jgi:hypothetical protein